MEYDRGGEVCSRKQRWRRWVGGCGEGRYHEKRPSELHSGIVMYCDAIEATSSDFPSALAWVIRQGLRENSGS